uniref:Uncharacterized protein n=1 Tax=Physcomitrium patens TaxID=3218 RepID=A0A2K1L3R5_PHYPA|nr:hypothetical protein PHYPA_003472 [Physcomitrium patens]
MLVFLRVRTNQELHLASELDCFFIGRFNFSVTRRGNARSLGIWIRAPSHSKRVVTNMRVQFTDGGDQEIYRC